MTSLRHDQQGVTLIESLIAILIFSMGILALVGMYSSAVSRTTDSQYRIEAANHANRIVGQIWANVDRSTAASLTASLNAFQHNPGGANCAYNGAASAVPEVTAWSNAITAAGTGLPGASAATNQIIVDTANFNRVTVTICWRAPGDTYAHRHVVVANIN
ncbi:MAG: type IV pilus modification protein PilV [Burkholderiales bacterium]|jgi:type IV pilus modification protein PilV|nr:type IV pilus modification protein PilV [Burkholderiales bacterium]